MAGEKCTALEVEKIQDEVADLAEARKEACDAQAAYKKALEDFDRINAECNAAVEEVIADCNRKRTEAEAALRDAETCWLVADEICSRQLAYVHDLVNSVKGVEDPTPE